VSPAPSSTPASAPLDEEDDDALDEAASQEPAEPSLELHVWGEGQPLPPVPRHPATQVCWAPSQTRPEVASPQSASVAHPQVSLARQAAPFPAAVQFLVFLSVHSTQRMVASHTSAREQSGSLRHCTQPWGWAMVLQTAVGAWQSALLLHGSERQAPTVPSILEQYAPVTQLSAPPAPPSAPTTRHPDTHLPVEVVEVSQ
jgi:hypothetical protein